MWEERDNKYHFILIDFDMATDVTPRSSDGEYVTSSKSRSGTLPFIARDIIKNMQEAITRKDPNHTGSIPHYLRHDLESLHYVVIYILAIYVLDGLTKEEIDDLREAMLSWESGSNLNTIWASKDSCCVSGFQTTLSPQAEPLKEWLAAWNDVFLKAAGALRRHVRDKKGSAPKPFDMETLKGTITPAKLRAALKPCMPLPVDVPVNANA